MHKVSLRATLKELWVRVVNLSTNKKEGDIYYNGEKNLYPNEIERVINNSPIAARAASIMAKYISGAGVTGPDGVEIKRDDLPIINKKHNLNIADIFEVGARSTAYQKGIFFWRGVSLDLSEAEPKVVWSQLEVLDYKKCRISKYDSDENAGKVYFRNWEIPEHKEDNKTQWFYPFSPIHDVMMAQVRRDFYDRNGEKAEFNLVDAVSGYRGQVMFLNLTPEFIYPLSNFDPAYNDCDTDYRVGLYNNSNTRNGFLGKILVKYQGIDKEKADEFEDRLQGWLGAENSGNLFMLEVENAENLDNAIKVDEIKPTFDPKLFIEVDGRNRRNILGCANNLPQQLIYASDGSLFAAGSDTLLQYKIFYSEQTEDERSALVRAVKQLGFDYGIKPIGFIDKTVVTNDSPAV